MGWSRFAAMAVLAVASASMGAHAQSRNWAGVYAGVHAGHAWGDMTPAFSSPDSQIQSYILNGGGDAFAIPARHSLDSWLGGVQIGYNWGVGSQIVAGLEADITLLDIDDTRSSRRDIFGVQIPGVTQTTTTVGIDWLSTLRARAGWLVDRSLLVYGTGGFAFAQAEQSHVVNDGSGTPQFFSGSDSGIVTGWALGGGIEFAISSSITIKAEYLRVKLDTPQARTTSFDPQCGTQCTFLTGGNDVNLDIGRVGLNHRF